MANPPSNRDDQAFVPKHKGAFTGWAHLQHALGGSLPTAIRTAKREARAIRKGRL